MNVRLRLWWIGPALALLALIGCRPADTPAAGEMMREMCEEGLMATPGGRGQVKGSGTCGAEARLVAVDASTTEPMDWMAQQPEFADHYMEDVRMGPPPASGGWRWETYITTPGTTLVWYWLENVTVEVQKKEVTETWTIPISHVACTGLPDGVGTMDCEVSVEAKSTLEQVSAASWGFRVKGTVGTPKWVPLGSSGSAELAGKLQASMRTSSETAAIDRFTSEGIKPNQTAYAFVVNQWSRFRTPTVVTGRLCHFTADEDKSCKDGHRENAVVTSVKHHGPLLGRYDPPEPAERREAEGDLYNCFFDDAVTKRSCRREATLTYGRIGANTNEGTLTLLTEGQLGPAKVEGESGMGYSHEMSQGTEVRYTYTLTITHDPESTRDIYFWRNRLGFQSGDTVTEGPWFVYCAPVEGSECR